MRGHLTGHVRWGPHKLQRNGGNNSSRSLDLGKLNPNCHMNYSIIFTEISLSRSFKFTINNLEVNIMEESPCQHIISFIKNYSDFLLCCLKIAEIYLILAFVKT